MCDGNIFYDNLGINEHIVYSHFLEEILFQNL